MSHPRKILAAVALLMALAILPSVLGLWPIPSSIRTALPGSWSMVWATLTCIAWLGCFLGNTFRLRLPTHWWPILIDLGASALVTISCVVYAIALGFRFESLASVWSIAPFGALAVVYGSRTILLWRDSLKVAADG